MIWSKNSFFFFFFLTVISQSACLSFQGLCHWNMYICMTAHGWPQMASDHTTSQEEIMLSQKKSPFAWKKNYELWLQGSYPFSQRLFHGPLWGQDHWKTLWCFHLHFKWLFNIMLSMKYNVIFPCVKPGDRENLLWKNSILMKYLQRKT